MPKNGQNPPRNARGMLESTRETLEVSANAQSWCIQPTLMVVWQTALFFVFCFSVMHY
jgi:hypothetical protein